MTDKEKAKAYDEALERAKKYNIDNAHACPGSIIKLIFPQLADNDDETIRKEIINFIYYKLDLGAMTHYHRSRVKYWIKYLEKQKEQKPEEINLKALLTADRLASAEMTGRLKERSEILENPEKYGLQKSAEWSKEDHNILEQIIMDYENEIRKLSGITIEKQLMYIYKKRINLLESIRYKFHYKPSEEQMKALKNVAYGKYKNGDGPVLRGLCEQLGKL